MSARRALAGLVLAGLVLAGAAAQAGAPYASPRPVARPAVIPDVAGVAGVAARDAAREAVLGVVLTQVLRAPARPAGMAPAGVVGMVPAPFDPRLAIALSPRPVARPAAVAAAVTAAAGRDERQPRRGSVCGDRRIRGVAVAAIPGRLRGCGVARPVRISEVSGLRLSRPAVMDCTTARALNDWVRRGVLPAVGRRGGGAVGLRVIADYSCRTRNNRPGAKISEHGRGRAIDIAGFTLENGSEISVLDDWGRGREGRILARIRAAACGPFGTVLGPGSDRYHRDHFHLDTARYRGGPYCR